jgi:hypothetical protein
MSEAHFDKESYLERLYLQPEGSPAVSISSSDDSQSTESDPEYDSECYRGNNTYFKDTSLLRKY